MAGGTTFTVAAPLICGVCHNGICDDDDRVMARLNSATKIILDHMIPVGGMATYDVVADGTILLLPPELENSIEAYPLNDAKVRGQKDVTQGWFELVSRDIYIDPAGAHDNPLVDLGLVPDPGPPAAPETLRRKYDYPGLQNGATVRVTGAKRYIEITDGDQYLIVQNIEAIKLIILSIERFENNAPTDGKAYRQEGFEMLEAEARKHLLDPKNSMRRKAEYENDLADFPRGTFGWTRARLALEVPGAMQHGKIELTRILEMSEMRLMSKGIWKNTIKTYTADVVHGYVYFPKDVEGVIAADLCGCPIPLKSEFFEYQENGPGMDGTCNGMLIDQGEETFASGNTRRKYKLNASQDAQTLSAVCKIRWIPKEPREQMVIKNFEALRLMFQAIINERAEQWDKAGVDQKAAVYELDTELGNYLRGLKRTLPIQMYGMGLGDVGSGGTL